MFTLPDLPYSHDALEPYIDAQTMELHHGKHHQAYVDKLNAALEGSDMLEKSIEEVLQNLDQLPQDKQTAVRNNGGGHYNHSLFWQWMAANVGGEPQGELADAISASFGSLNAFKEEFAAAAVGRFGSGWVWLTRDGQTGLKISSTPNQDSPIMEGIEPLLGLDVWEHAYYLKYQNKRPDYIEAWWNVVNWQEVENRFKKPA